MRAALQRVTMLAVGCVIAILVIPDMLFRLWLVSRLQGGIGDIAWPLTGVRGVVLVVSVTVIQVIAALAIAQLLAARQANRLSAPLTELADRAERLAAGESRIVRMDSGIPEIDRVGDVLARNAADHARQLAQQRDFAADASHQLRTPLTALLMRLDEINATDNLEDAQEEAGIAIAQVERLTTVVDELLARSRRGEGQVAVSLDAVLVGLQREWHPVFAESRRSIRIHGERGLHVRAGASAVAQIVSTLLENSLQHGRGTGDVHARLAGPSVVLEVSDDGPGVSPQLAPHIFERSVSSSGSGLGLALARDLAAAADGRLELISAQPAVFALFLSEAQAPHA